MSATIDWKPIVRDVVRGMTDAQLRDKYALSADQLTTVYQRLSEIRRRRIRALVCDIAEGIDPQQLMEKYGLSPTAMVRVMNQILRGSLNGWLREARANRAALLTTDSANGVEPKFLNSRDYPPRHEMAAAIGYSSTQLDDMRQ
ncbi:MAG: hypothetical protein HY914_08055 [Desulfomonile tiedjei]|nr:hypothetical protein [Desulfomonile tiedjei]